MPAVAQVEGFGLGGGAALAGAPSEGVLDAVLAVHEGGPGRWLHFEARLDGLHAVCPVEVAGQVVGHVGRVVQRGGGVGCGGVGGSARGSAVGLFAGGIEPLHGLPSPVVQHGVGEEEWPIPSHFHAPRLVYRVAQAGQLFPHGGLRPFRVAGGEGHGQMRFSFERGTEERAVQTVKGGEEARLLATGVPLAQGEMLWLAADARDSWGMRGAEIRRFDVRRVE